MTDNPDDLIGQQLDFKVKIEKLTKLPEDFCRNIYCEYQFYTDEAINKTTSCPEKNTDPIIKYEKHHTIEVVTKYLLDYLKDDKLTIRIYGTQELHHSSKKGGKDTSMINSSLNSSKSTLDNSGMK